MSEDTPSVYINMIRDPIARFESFYYFSRFGNVKGGGGNAKLPEVQRLETVDQVWFDQNLKFDLFFSKMVMPRYRIWKFRI